MTDVKLIQWRVPGELESPSIKTDGLSGASTMVTEEEGGLHFICFKRRRRRRRWPVTGAPKEA